MLMPIQKSQYPSQWTCPKGQMGLAPKSGCVKWKLTSFYAACEFLGNARVSIDETGCVVIGAAPQL